MGAKLHTAGGKYNVRQNSEINVTPFVDVMLVLIIIFMVSIPAAVVSIKLDLPTASQPEAPVTPPVFISVMGHGVIYIGPNKSSPTTLIADVTAALNSKDPYNERVLVRGDKDIAYEDFVKVLNALQQNGFHKVGLVNEDLE